MVDSINNDQGAVALDINQLQNWLRGDTIVSGVAPSPGSGSLEVDVASGTARVGGSNVSVSGQTTTLSSGGSNPRKDLVYIDSSGNVQVAEGTAAAARPSGSVRFDTYDPAPPDSTGITGAVVATVWVASGKSGTFASADIRDRRLLSAIDVDTTTTESLGFAPGGTIEEDANSPLDAAGAQSHTLTLDGSYDVVWVVVQKLENTSGGGQKYQLRVNGVSSGYTDFYGDGTETSSKSEWYIANDAVVDGDISKFGFELGRSIRDRISFDNRAKTDSVGLTVTGGRVNTDPPVDSITFMGDTGNIAVKARALGWSG